MNSNKNVKMYRKKLKEYKKYNTCYIINVDEEENKNEIYIFGLLNNKYYFAKKYI